MTENEVMEKLYDDISRLKLPPISEKVLQAMDEKRKQSMEMNTELLQVKKPHKSVPTKYIFAAMLTLLVIYVPIIVVLTSKAPVSDLPGNSRSVSIPESQLTSTVENETALERIKLKQLYGEVALSGKSKEELETLLVTYSKENSVYEDKQYIYNFDTQGELVEICKIALEDENGSFVTYREVSEKTERLLKEYYSEWKTNDYKTDIFENIDVYPAWTVCVTRENDDLTKEMITMTYDKTGNLRRMILSGTAENVGIISRAEAIDIAIREIMSEKYGIPPFKIEDVDISVEIKKIDKVYYSVTVNNIHLDKKTTISVYLEISANTGEIINIVI